MEDKNYKNFIVTKQLKYSTVKIISFYVFKLENYLDVKVFFLNLCVKYTYRYLNLYRYNVLKVPLQYC